MSLKKRLMIAKKGYKSAINALPYMPIEAKEYTRATADRYHSEIQVIEELIRGGHE